MLIQITNDKYLNADYILCLMIAKTEKDITTGVMVAEEATKIKLVWSIVARMIDNSSQLLLEFDDEKKAREELDRLLKEANKRIKEIKYE